MRIKQLVRNYMNIVVAQVFTSIVAVIVVKISLKHVSTEEYGNIVIILAASNTIQVFLNWTCAALVRFGVEEFIADKNIINTFWARTLIFVLNLLLILILSPLWFSLLQNFMGFHVNIKPLIILHIIVGSLWMHGQQALQAIRKPQLQSYLLLAERCLTLLVITIIVSTYLLSWEKIFWVLIISSMVMFMISLIALKKFISFSNWNKVKQSATQIFKFSLPLFPFAITNFFCTNYLNAYFINAYLTKSDLTVFNTTFQITGLLMQLPILFNTLLMPQFISMRMENRQSDIKRYMESILPLMSVLWAIGVGAASFLIVWFIPSFFGNHFYGIAPVIVLLSAGAMFSFPSLVGFSPFVLSLSDVKVSFPMALVTASVNILAQFALIKPFGLVGSAIATLLSVISGFLYIMLYVNRKYKFKSEMLLLALLPATVSIIIYMLVQNILLFFCCLVFSSFIFLITVRKQVVPYLNFALGMLKQGKGA